MSTVLALESTHYHNFSVRTATDVVALKFPADTHSETLASIQTGNFLSSPGSDISSKLSNYYSWHWQRCETLGAFDLPHNARILDLGSGLGIVDLVAAKLLPEARFWLVDQNAMTYDPEHLVRHGQEHPYYNSWTVVEDLIASNQLSRQQFVLQPIDSAWPQDLDLLLSTWCWCWHIPFEIYWKSALASLRVGGKLCLDIRAQHLDQVVPVINEVLGPVSKLSAYQGFVGSIDESLPITGYRCLWQRQ